MTEKTLLVGLDAYLYLLQLCIIQRGRAVTPSDYQHHVENFNEFSNDGKKEIFSGDLGGGIGSRNPSTWSSWSLDHMARILDNAGYSYEFGSGKTIGM